MPSSKSSKKKHVTAKSTIRNSPNKSKASTSTAAARPVSIHRARSRTPVDSDDDIPPASEPLNDRNDSEADHTMDDEDKGVEEDEEDEDNDEEDKDDDDEEGDGEEGEEEGREDEDEEGVTKDKGEDEDVNDEKGSDDGEEHTAAADATQDPPSSTAAHTHADIPMTGVSGQERIYQTRDAANLVSVIGDRLAAKNVKSQAIADDAHLGYCAFPMIDTPPGVKWGKINNREVMQPAVKKLLDGFEENGMLSALPDRVIRIAVKKKWVSTKLMSTTSGKNVLQLPLFELTEEGKEVARKGEIIPYSGNHRRAALAEHKKATKKNIKVIQREIKKLAPKKNAKNTKNAIPSDRAALELEEKKEYLAEMETRLEMCHLWGAELYDLGGWCLLFTDYNSLTYIPHIN